MLSSIMGFLTILLMNKLNIRLKMLTYKIHTSQQTYINFFTVTKCSTIIDQMKKY